MIGADISLVARDKDALQIQGDYLKSEFEGNVSLSSADITIEKEIVRSFKASVNTNGPINILINNAGIGKSMPFHKMDLDF